MHVGAVRDLLVRQREASPRKMAQSGGGSEDLNAGLAVPDQDIAAFRLDHHPGVDRK